MTRKWKRLTQKHVLLAADRFRILSIVGNDIPGRFVSEDPVEERWHADGTADIGAQSEGRSGGSLDRTFASTGATDDPVGVVRIPRSAVDCVGTFPPGGYGIGWNG